jgi:hypothetical protein
MVVLLQYIMVKEIMVKEILFLILITFLSANCFARPVSYAGGYTAMFNSNSLRDTLYLHYSPTWKDAVGVEAVNDKSLNDDYAYFRYTRLLFRKNTRHSQGNIYLNTGISNNGFENYFYGVQADWETRRVFTGFGYKRTETDKLNINEKYFSVGIAPYIGEYGAMHTWLLVKFKENSYMGTSSLYPVLKLFKGNALMEVGYHANSNWDIHLMYRF